MPVTIVPTKMKVSKKAFKGGGGMDIATRKDALVDALTKAASKFTKGNMRLSDSDIARQLSKVRGMLGKGMDKKAGGGKAKKMMAKGGAAGGKKKMMGGGKAKKMMAGGGKTKKMMRGGGKTKKYMARGGKAR
jgi:hypothetical protein